MPTAPTPPNPNNGSAPPYSLAAHKFPFRALTAQAARAPIGGAREVALACLMAARMTAAAPEAALLPLPLQKTRTASAKNWFASVPPPPLRPIFARLVELLPRATPPEIAQALSAILSAARRYLDTASVGEMEQLIRTLQAGQP